MDCGIIESELTMNSFRAPDIDVALEKQPESAETQAEAPESSLTPRKRERATRGSDVENNWTTGDSSHGGG